LKYFGEPKAEKTTQVEPTAIDTGLSWSGAHKLLVIKIDDSESEEDESISNRLIIMRRVMDSSRHKFLGLGRYGESIGLVLNKLNFLPNLYFCLN
jgi:hypothetical protein